MAPTYQNHFVSWFATLLPVPKPSMPEFSDQILHNAMDNTFRQLRQSGVGSAIKSAEAKELCESGVLGVHDPKVLLQTDFS